MKLPLPNKKVEQHNFAFYADARAWLQINGFSPTGMVLDEPWKEYFVERWEKDGFIALTLNVSFLPMGHSLSLPLDYYKKPYQIDIATID